jgi:nucleoside-diphosphate-sugar epimerase
MKVVILGGTRFIGRHIARQAMARGDDVTVVHRGEHEPAELAEIRHIHNDRASFCEVADQVAALHPDAVIDSIPLTAADVDAVLPHLPDTHLTALSSVDVYRAFALVNADAEGEVLPITEDSAVRGERYLYRGKIAGFDDYEKLDVEPAYIQRGGTVLRLSMIYGEHDGQRREEFILRRVRAERTAIPVGGGGWLATRCYAGDVASAVLLAAGSQAAEGQVFNVGEPQTRSVLGWAGQILTAAGYTAELVRVPDELLPADMSITKDLSQHLLLDSGKLGRTLGWQPRPIDEAIGKSVAWHLAHPPEQAEQAEQADAGFAADDRALAAPQQRPVADG